MSRKCRWLICTAYLTNGFADDPATLLTIAQTHRFRSACPKPQIMDAAVAAVVAVGSYYPRDSNDVAEENKRPIINTNIL